MQTPLNDANMHLYTLYILHSRASLISRNTISTIPLGIKLHLRDGRTDGQTSLESNLVHFSLKMWHLVATILTNFLNWPNFVYLLVDPGFYPTPLNFYEASRFVTPIGCTPPETQRKKRRTNERTKRCVSSSVRLLDGVIPYSDRTVRGPL